MKKLLLCLPLLLLASWMPEGDDHAFKGTFYNKENDITIALDLYDTTLVAPNYSFLGKLNGYISGKLYDTWFATSHKIDQQKAVVNFTNDLGSDEQRVQFSWGKKGELIYEAQGSNALRRAENRRWIKIPAKMVFVRKESKQK